jgi:hypothetical protein
VGLLNLFSFTFFSVGASSTAGASATGDSVIGSGVSVSILGSGDWIGAPQLKQNFASSGNCLPHFEQNITFLLYMYGFMVALLSL